MKKQKSKQTNRMACHLNYEIYAQDCFLVDCTAKDIVNSKEVAKKTENALKKEKRTLASSVFVGYLLYF